MRVGWQVAHGGAPLFDEGPDLRGLMRGDIVQQHDVATTEPWREAAPNPLDEARFGHGTPLRAQRHPAASTYRADQRHVVAPVHRPRFHILLPTLDPCVRASHRDIGSCLIEKHQPIGIDATHPVQKRGPFPGDVRPVDLTRARAFFLSMNPSRRRARWQLDRVVRCARGTRRLYSRHSSVTVASGRSRTTARKMTTSIGHGQPPPFGCGSTDRVSRHRATHRSRVRWSTPNIAANCAYDPSPRSYAVTARSRNATSYGLGMAPSKYTSFGNSSGIRD